MDSPPLAAPLDEIVSASGIAYPNGIPYTHITAALVVWNEEKRLGRLLDWLRPFFATLAVAVQESDDSTFLIAREFADILILDRHRGYGDATFGPKLLPHVTTPWTFKVDADEWPSEDLLRSLSSATWYAEHLGLNGMWIPFRSWVDDIEYTEQHGHLRLFKTELGWPGYLHSRPPTEQTAYWQTGHMAHSRSVDEMIRDYLRYLRIGQGHPGWTDHNKLMLRSAASGTAAVRGWAYIKSFDWWPEVLAEAFDGKDPEE